MSSPEVDRYLAGPDPKRREALSELRGLVRGLVPDAIETVKYSMPTYEYQNGVLCAFASQKHYMSMYMHTELVAQHRAELAELSAGKSCIRFRRLSDLPLDTVRAILHETQLKMESAQQRGDRGSI